MPKWAGKNEMDQMLKELHEQKIKTMTYEQAESYLVPSPLPPEYCECRACERQRNGVVGRYPIPPATVSAPPPPPSLLETGVCLECGMIGTHTHRIPPPTPSAKPQTVLGAVRERQKCRKDMVYRYDGTSQCICSDCIDAATKPERMKPTKRFFDEPKDHFDTEYEEWRVEAGLIEPYYRQVIQNVVTERYACVDKMDGEIIEDPSRAPKSVQAWVKLPLKPEDQYANYSQELRWRLTDLGKETVWWDQKWVSAPSGNHRKKIVIDWDKTKPLAKNRAVPAVDVLLILTIAVPIGILAIAVLLVVNNIIPLSALQIVPLSIVIFGLISGKLIPSYAVKELERENSNVN